jgi:hypothetical protein
LTDRAIPLETILLALRDAAAWLEIPVAQITHWRYVEARDGGCALPCGVGAINRAASQVGGWAALRAKAADPDVLALPLQPAGHRIKGVSTMARMPDGSIRWVKTAEDREAREEQIAELIAELPARVTPRPAVPFVGHAGEEPDENLLAVYPMGDPHIGMLSWAPESGHNFDLRLAVEINQRAMDHLARQGPRTRDALIVNLGDFFHADNASNRTPASGHALDVDGRRPKILRAGLDLMVYMIDRALENHERVKVDNQIGNHDSESALFLSVGLAAYYRNDPRVTILEDPSHYHAHQWGRVLLCTHHGHGAKAEHLPGVMLSRWPDLVGLTTLRRWLTGHIHHKRLIEFPGCRVESFNTLAARDAWHAHEGYDSERDMCRIVYDRRGWEHGRTIASAEMLACLYREAVRAASADQSSRG